MNEQLTTTLEEIETHAPNAARPTNRLTGRIAEILAGGIERCSHLPHLDRRHLGTLKGLVAEPEDEDHRSPRRPSSHAAAARRRTGRAGSR